MHRHSFDGPVTNLVLSAFVFVLAGLAVQATFADDEAAQELPKRLVLTGVRELNVRHHGLIP